MSKETALIILCFWIVFCMSVTEIRKQQAADVKAALELIREANALCKEAR